MIIGAERVSAGMLLHSLAVRAGLPLIVLLVFSVAVASQRRLSLVVSGPGSGAPGHGEESLNVEHCLHFTSFTERVSCARPMLEASLRARGPRAVLAELDRLQAESPLYRVHCHDLAHVLGRSWVAGGGTMADGFREGSNVCHSGFYHGMVERALRGNIAPDAEPDHLAPQELRQRVGGVCTPAALGTASRNLQFQCLHGLGHAITFSLGYDLPHGLEICDVLADDWSQRSCYGGAFMENITGVERDRRMLKADDPHYPCSVVGERYRDACYIMQTSRMLEMGMSWKAIVRACRESGPHRLACFQSFGRDVSPRVRQEGPQAYVALCTDLRPDERDRCIKGAVFALADHTWDGRYAYPYCAAFPIAELRQFCFSTAHEHLQGPLEQPQEHLARDCRSFAAVTPECLSTL